MGIIKQIIKEAKKHSKRNKQKKDKKIEVGKYCGSTECKTENKNLNS